MGHRKYAALQEAAKQCEKTDPVRRSGRSTKRSQTVIDAIDAERHAAEEGQGGGEWHGFAAAAASSKRVRKELLDGETPLDPTTVKGLGSRKVERLTAVGIRTVEQLARADITDRALVEAVTRSRCFNEGATTLINWKGRAIAFLERKFSGRGGLLLNTARLAALREDVGYS